MKAIAPAATETPPLEISRTNFGFPEEDRTKKALLGEVYPLGVGRSREALDGGAGVGAEERCKVDHFEDVYFREESRGGEEEEEEEVEDRVHGFKRVCSSLFGGPNLLRRALVRGLNLDM